MYISFLFQGELNVPIAMSADTPKRSAPHPIFRGVLLIGAAAVAAIVAKEKTGTATASNSRHHVIYNFF